MPTTNKNNSEVIEGRIYQQNLTLRKVENKDSKNYGKDFINGSIDIATTDDDMNILTIHYTYVSPLNKNNAENRTFTALKRIMDEDKTIVTVGHDAAQKVRCTPAIALNDFYPQGRDELVSAPRNEGGFVNIINELTPEGQDRNKFTADALISTVARQDDDANGAVATVRALIFNFRGAALPINFVLHNEDAISYFESLDPSPSNMIFTKVWGKIVSRTESQTSEVESAFGEPTVDIKQRRVREWVITGAAKEPYDYGEGSSVLTPEEVKEALANREVELANIKKRSEDYYNNRSQGNAPATDKIPTGSFQF